MLEELPASECPRCGSSAHVRPKLIATNFLRQPQFLEPFVAKRVKQFQESSFSWGGYFVSGLFCDSCDSGFLPDAVAEEMGLQPCRDRGSLSVAARPFGLGYPRPDRSFTDSKTALRPFNAIIWQRSPDSIGIRVTIHAPNVTAAHEILVKEHGADAIISVWNDEDAENPR